MPVPIFSEPKPKPQVEEIKAEEQKKKASGLVVFFSVFLVVALVFTAELGMRDANRYLNTEYQDCVQKKKVVTIFKPSPVPEDCDIQKYEGLRLLLHADIIIPVSLIILISLYVYIARFKRKGKDAKEAPHVRLLRISFISFVIWLGGRLVVETEYFLLKHHNTIGKYVVLGTLIIILVFLIVYVQKNVINKLLK